MYMIDEPSGHLTPSSEKNSFQSRSWFSSPSSFCFAPMPAPKPAVFISLMSLEAVFILSMKVESTG